MSAGWNTIESDAGVFTYLIEKLGVKDVQFEELVSLEEESLYQLSPVYGVIFLFKYPTNEPSASAISPDQPLDGTYDHAAADSLFFASQVIQNACGTQALLSVLLNKDPTAPTTAPTATIDIGADLTAFKSFTAGFPPDLRGEALSNSSLIRSVHNSFARSSPFIDETARPATASDDDAVYHFIAYTCLASTLYELDGLQPAPISHGPCSPEDFPAAVVPVLRRRIGRYPASEIRFNLLAMTRDLRGVAREAGDWEEVERLEGRRREWVWENELRRHNFLGFAREVLGGVVGMKVKEGGEEGYRRWVREAEAETRRKVEGRRRRARGEGEEIEVDG